MPSTWANFFELKILNSSHLVNVQLVLIWQQLAFYAVFSNHADHVFNNN